MFSILLVHTKYRRIFKNKVIFPDVLVHGYNVSNWEPEAGGSLQLQGQLGPPSEIRVQPELIVSESLSKKIQ